ncbi:MAG: PepSY-like domain-containing protein [Bacteroidales bacterium]
MKKTISLLTGLFLISSIMFSQTISTGKVPKSAKKAFAKEFAKAVKPEWSLSEGNYKVDFLLNGVKNAVFYDNSGAWQEKDVAVSIPRMPKEIKATMTKEFPGFRTTEVWQVTTPDKVIKYHIGVMKMKEAYDVYFTPAGDILKKDPKVQPAPVQKKKK